VGARLPPAAVEGHQVQPVDACRERQPGPDLPLSELKRSTLREVMAVLLARGLSKGMIDGTSASLSRCCPTLSTTK